MMTNDVPLTPNHFLHGQVGGEFAPKAPKEINYNPKKRWRRIQELTRHFGTDGCVNGYKFKFKKKWYQSRKNVQVNDTVFLVSPESPRAHWPLGKVIVVYPWTMERWICSLC